MDTRRTLRGHNTTAASYEDLFLGNNAISNLTINGSSSATRVARKIDPKQRARGKALLAALKNEKECADISESVVEGRTLVSCVRREVVRLGGTSMSSVEQTDLIKDLDLLGISDVGVLLRQLLTNMERYIPRTKHNPGTAQSLKDAHNRLMNNITTTFSDYWSICRVLDNMATIEDIVRLVFPSFLESLQYQPVTGQLPVLRLLATWCEFYNVQVFGQTTTRLISTMLPRVCRSAGDLEVQMLVAVMLRCLWEADPKLVEDFACATDLRTCLPDFCRLFRESYPSDSSRSTLLPFKVAQFLNERNGTHRRVFSFPLTDQSTAYRLSPSSDLQPLIGTDVPDDTLEPLLWQLYFSIASAMVSFRVQTSESHTAIVQVPAKSINFVEALPDRTGSVAQVSFLLSDGLERFLVDPSDESGAVDGVLSHCDRLTFYLQITSRRDLIELENALELFFSSRKSERDFGHDIQLSQEDEGPSVAKLNGSGRTGEALTRKEEEECYRQPLTGLKLVLTTTLYEGRTIPEEPKRLSNKAPAKENRTKPVMEDDTMEVTLVPAGSTNLDLPPGAIVIQEPIHKSSNGLVVTMMQGVDGGFMLKLSSLSLPDKLIQNNGHRGVDTGDSEQMVVDLE